IETNQAVLDRVDQREKLSESLERAAEAQVAFASAVSAFDAHAAASEEVAKFLEENKADFERLAKLSAIPEAERTEEEQEVFPGLAALPGRVVALQVEALEAAAGAEGADEAQWDGVATTLTRLKKSNHAANELTADDFRAFVAAIDEIRELVVVAESDVELLTQEIVDLDIAQAADLKKLGLEPITENLSVLKAELEAAELSLDIDQQIDDATADGAKEDTLESLRRLQQVQQEFAEDLDGARKKVSALAFRLKSKNADRDEKRADYDLGIRDNADGGTLADRLEEFGGTQGGADELALELQDAEVRLEELSDPDSEQNKGRSNEVATLLERQAALDEKKKAVEKLTASLTLIQDSLDDIDPQDIAKSGKRWFMSWWIVEGFNGQRKVVQDWLPDLHQTLGMTRIARFDRCRTCHMNVDATAPGSVAAFPGGTPSDPDDVDVWVEENKFPHPFATHPNHELFVTASSPHPVSTFGCTSCHDGQGSGVDFQNAEHGPNDPYQAEEWHHDHGYHPNHFWEYPMQPKRFQESTCIKCHHSVVELEHSPEFGNSAPTVTKGFNLMRKYGCFGCHEIHGFDGGNPIGPDIRLEPQTPEQAKRIADDPTQVAGKFRKVGPSLRHVASKTTQDFIAYWTQEPSRYRPTTKMPAPFNIRDHLDRDDELTAKFESVELAGIAKVLIDGSQEIDLLAPATGYQPNAERGKELFSTRGCLACHQHDGVPGTTAEFGPNITDIHRKVRRNSDDPNFSDWLYTWIKEPTRHHERTKMPNLFLDPYQKGGETVDPAADIAAWLLSQGKPQVFPQMEVHDAQLDSLVTIYLRKARFRDKVVEEILKSRQFPRKAGDVKGDEKVLATEGGEAVADAEEWRQRKLAFVGQKTIARYGCYGCHDIPGFEDARPIGVALQDWGRKDTSKLGVEHIEHFLHHHGEANGRASDLKTGGAARVRISVPSTGESANAKSVTFRRGDAGISVEDGVITISSPENMTVGGLVAAAQASPLVRVELVSGSADTEVEIAKTDGLDVDLAWSTADRVKNAMGMAKDGSVSGEELESELSHAYFYDSLLHHGRPGFLWQKLRAPRSYDYMKT
ncbi:MAG TPA: hypothetical protein DCG12_09610, partial [Planctomycetaceae bacterium]|nr:hypothetical protein [Planctomycetaceae bacterium]